jgi:hypothetical protein
MRRLPRLAPARTGNVVRCATPPARKRHDPPFPVVGNFVCDPYASVIRMSATGDRAPAERDSARRSARRMTTDNAVCNSS